MRRLLFILAILCAPKLFAATITSNAVTGNWSAGTSWVGGIVPGPADNAVIVSGAVITLNVNATIVELQINTGGTVNASSNTLTITGDFFNNGTFNSQTGTVHFNGFSLPQSIFGTSITTFNNIINDNTNGSTGMGVTAHEVETRIKGNFVQNGVFNRNSTSFPAATIRFVGNTFVTGTTSLIMNHVIIDAGATLHAATGVFPQSSNTYISGNYTNNGTLDPGTGTINFQYANGAGNNQTINAGASSFYNLTINKSSGTASAASNVTVLNDYTIAAGTWSASSFNLTVGGDFSNSGTFTAGTGLVLLNGTSNQSVNTGTSSLYNFTVNKSGGSVDLLSNVTATNNATLTLGNIYTTNSFELFTSNSNSATSLTGGSSSSFVIGRLRRAVIAGAATYAFPIGPMNETPVKYRPVSYQQTTSGGASNISMIGDTIGNTGIRKADWYVRIGSNAGNPTGTLRFSYNLSTDFPAGMQECIINAIRGTQPPPANWNFVLTTTVAPSGGTNGFITAAIPATLSPNSFILGEPTPVASGTTICSGNTAALSVTSPTGNVQYNWYSASTGGTLLQSNSSSYTTPVLTSNNTYFVEYFNTLTSCSSPRTAIPVTVNQTPVASFTAFDSICTSTNTTITFNGTAGGAAAYTWNFNGGTVSSGSGAGPYQVQWNSAGTKNITLSATENSCTSNLFTQPIVVGATPVASFSVSPTSCQGDTLSVVFTGTAGSNAGYNWNFGGATILSGSGAGPYSISYSTPGTKNITLTVDDYNCNSNSNQSITVNPTPTAPSVSATSSTICQGASTTITASGSTGGTISYNFYDQNTGGALIGSSPLTVSPSSTTTYYLEVINSTGCTSSWNRTPVTITVDLTPTPATVSISNDTICQGMSTTITASGSTGGTISYNFYDQNTGGTLLGSSPLTVSPSSSTTYYLEVINSQGCTSSATRTPVSITVNPTPTAASVTITNDTICAGDATTITASGSTGGSINYNFYDQSSGGTLLGTSPLTVTPSTTTTYFLEVINSNGCTSSSSRTPVTITVNPSPSSATVTASNDTICQGDQTTLTASGATGGTVTYQFYDQSAGGTLLGSSPLTVTPVTTTTYYLEVSNTAGCGTAGARTPVTITVNPTPTSPTVTVSNDTICQGAQTTIAASGSTGGTVNYNFYDQSSGGTLLGTSPFSVSPSNTTTYYLEVINTNGCTSSPSRTPVTITVNPTPTPPTVTTTNDTICQGDQTTITASGSTGGTISYNFYDQSSGGNLLGASPLSVTPTTTTTYYLEVINTNGCMSSAMRTPVTIAVNPTPTPATVTVSNDTICQGDQTTITATGSTGGTISYDFYDQSAGGNLLGTSPLTVSPSNTTTYYLEVVNSNGCFSSATRTPVTVTVNPTPTAATVSVSNDTVCQGDQTTITASGSTGGTISYDFYDQSTGGTLLGASPLTVSPSSTTTYYLELINTVGCTSTPSRTPVTITVNPTPSLPTVMVSNDTICQGDQTTITASGSTGGTISYNFYDQPTGGSMLGSSPLSVTPSNTTIYYLEVINSNGCMSSSSRTPVTVTVNPTPTPATVSVSNDTICDGQQTILSATGSTGGTVNYNFYDQSTGGTLLGTSPFTVSPSSTTTYYLEVINTDGCLSSSTREPIMITVNPTPSDPTASNATICSGNSASLTASSTSGSIEWHDNSSATNLLYTGTSFVTPILQSSTSYWIQTVSPQGCYNAGGPQQVTVTVDLTPQVTLSVSPSSSIVTGQSVTITATPSGYDFYDFIINNQSVQSGSESEYTSSLFVNGDQVIVKVTDGNCNSTSADTLVLEVKPLPNAFTPNGDGKNDRFIKGLDVTILNRWGQQLYRGTDGWDGTFEGKSVTPGTYFYVIRLKDEAGDEKVVQGPLTLIAE